MPIYGLRGYFVASFSYSYSYLRERCSCFFIYQPNANGV